MSRNDFFQCSRSEVVKKIKRTTKNVTSKFLAIFSKNLTFSVIFPSNFNPSPSAMHSIEKSNSLHEAYLMPKFFRHFV